MNSVDYSIHPEKASLLLPFSQINIIPILNMYLLFSEMNVALTSHQQTSSFSTSGNYCRHSQLFKIQTTDYRVPDPKPCIYNANNSYMEDGGWEGSKSWKTKCLLLVPSRHVQGCCIHKISTIWFSKKGPHNDKTRWDANVNQRNLTIPYHYRQSIIAERRRLGLL